MGKKSNVIELLNSIKDSDDAEKIVYLSMTLPDKLFKLKFINPSTKPIFLFDLEVKKYIYEEVKYHRYNISKNSVERLRVLISYLEELETYEK